MAEEGGADGIRVNTVNPDAVLQGSKIWGSSWREERAAAYNLDPEELDEHYRQRNTLKVSIYPQDIAEAVLHFASEQRSGKSHREHPERRRRRAGGVLALGRVGEKSGRELVIPGRSAASAGAMRMVGAVLALVLAMVPSAYAMPGDPPVTPGTPADGATLPVSADGIPVTFPCPLYRVADDGFFPIYGAAYDWGVSFSTANVVGADGRLANPVSLGPGARSTPRARAPAP